MTELALILQLFWVFFVIGLFTFGGGYAMLSFIQTQVVVAHGWLTGASHLVGILGSLSATFAVILPSFMIVLAIVKFYTKFKNSRVFASVLASLRPAVVGLIGAAALILMFSVDWNGIVPEISIVNDNFPDLISWGLFAAAVVASMVFRIGPIKIIIAGGILGLLLY